VKMNLSNAWRLALAAFLLVAGFSQFLAAQTASVRVPDLSGGWVRVDDVGSGSFGGLTSTFTAAVLTPEAAAVRAGGRDPDDVDPDKGPHAVGQPYIVTAGGCGGPPGIEPNSAALFLVQAKGEVLWIRENPGARHIYMDGRKHPDLTRWTPTNNGHSIGHYEDGALVIDTIGLSPGMVTAGGRRTPETHLTERLAVTPDGKRMTITYTWEDPRIYVKPHTYQISFDRVPPGGYAYEGWCDSSDPLQRQSVVPPKQLP